MADRKRKFSEAPGFEDESVINKIAGKYHL